MSYIPLKDLGVSERKPRFNNTTHNAIFYTLHVISITLFTILYFTRSTDTSTTINWYNYDEKTDTLHIGAKTVVIGIKSLERTLGSSEKIKPKLVVHGTVHSTEIDVEKDVIFRGDTKLIHGKDGQDGLQGLAGKDGQNGLQGLPGKDGKDGPQGLPGKDGQNGLQGLPGNDGQNGPQGLSGEDGKDGPQGLPGQDASNEWWKYDHENGILHILSNVTTLVTLDVSKDAFVHGMMTTSDLDVSAPQHEPMNLKP